MPRMRQGEAHGAKTHAGTVFGLLRRVGQKLETLCPRCGQQARPVIVVASPFRLHKLSQVPRFFLDAMKIHRQVTRSEGTVGGWPKPIRYAASSSP
ncbi:hypothetical protein GCM10022223_25990 [Kineosporia mesophila]|uniref:Uncharacterized protein n=1 Tax=Kineosporia mesophila TaxID=566012 RepID=A0ABP6ZGB1_9ACTN